MLLRDRITLKKRLFGFVFFVALLATQFAMGDLYEPISVYLTIDSDPSTSMTVRWITRSDRLDDLVQYKTCGSPDWSNIVGSSIPMPDRHPYLIHYVQLQDLKPDTDYCFTIGEEGKQFQFKTLPDNLDQPIRFVVGGDMYHDGLDVFNQMNSAVAATNPMFAVLGGDIAYSAPKLRFFSENFSRWLEWMVSWKETMVTRDGRLIPFLITIGNHEVIGRFHQSPERAKFFYSLFKTPDLRGFNVVDFGSYMSFFLLDSAHTHPIDGEQKQWLMTSLQDRADTPHKFAVYHVPAFPSVRKFTGKISKQIRAQWVPLFEAYGLNAAFEHHDHAYKRTHPIYEEKIDQERGVIYLGDGAWGVEKPRKPKNSKDRWYLAVTQPKRHFILVTLFENERHFTAIDHARNIFDHSTNSTNHESKFELPAESKF